MRYPVWMTGGVGDPRRPRIGRSKDGEPRKPETIHDRFQVHDRGVEREVNGLTLGQTGTAAVIPD